MAKDPHAAALGRKGGKARMKKLTVEERKQLARGCRIGLWGSSQSKGRKEKEEILERGGA